MQYFSENFEGTKFLAANLTANQPVTGIVIPLEAYPEDDEIERTISYEYYRAADGQVVSLHL